MSWKHLPLAAAIMLSACGRGDEASPSGSDAATAAPSEAPRGDGTTLSLKELMAHVFQFSAEGIWNRQGYVSDARGERSLFPKNDREWEEAESASLTLAELSNVLLLDGRKLDDPRWEKSVLAMRTIALRAATAAETKNQEAFFDAGSELDEACEACHTSFAPWAENRSRLADHIEDARKGQ